MERILLPDEIHSFEHTELTKYVVFNVIGPDGVKEHGAIAKKRNWKQLLDTAIALAERKYKKRTHVHRNTPINMQK